MVKMRLQQISSEAAQQVLEDSRIHCYSMMCKLDGGRNQSICPSYSSISSHPQSHNSYIFTLSIKLCVVLRCLTILLNTRATQLLLHFTKPFCLIYVIHIYADFKCYYKSHKMCMLVNVSLVSLCECLNTPPKQNQEAEVKRDTLIPELRTIFLPLFFTQTRSSLIQRKFEKLFSQVLSPYGKHCTPTHTPTCEDTHRPK